MKPEVTISLIKNPIEIEISQNENSPKILKNQLAINEDILREREEVINTLCNEVQQVSEMFQDLSILIHDQREHIDNIETNITQASNYTERCTRQLVASNRYQK